MRSAGLRWRAQQDSNLRPLVQEEGGFAREAKNAALEPGAAPITLIDGERLIDMMLDHDIGITVRRVEPLGVESTACDPRKGSGAWRLKSL